MSFISSLVSHLREGTFVERLRCAYDGRQWLPSHVRVRWNGAEHPDDAARALARWAKIFIAADAAGWVLCLGERQDFHQLLERRLRERGVRFRSHSLQEVAGWGPAQAAGIKGIVCGYADARDMTHAARALALHPTLGAVPFEYAAGINPEKGIFSKRDEYAETHFVAPGLLDEPTPYQLYEESLSYFEQKCGLRDFLDLYQILRYVVRSGVPGDIAEFGSYKGHSGYLIARTLQALASDKTLYMFDTFEEFPREAAGMDHFWNRSHYVNFDEVRAKFSALANVRLVRGDFTQTMAGSGLDKVALAYVDCDSYRATRYLIEAIWDKKLSPRGALVCEDYGHPALLGSRAAVHEEFERRPDSFQYFSQFSGLYITLKIQHE